MLSKPESGWSSISLFDFQAEASYLLDIPYFEKADRSRRHDMHI